MKKLIRILIVMVVIAASIVSYSIYRKHQNRPEWRLSKISVGNIREEVTASGTLNPSTRIEVGTEISGKILKLYKDFNDNVKKGELLAKLDTENLESSLESARSDVTRSQISVMDAKIDLDLQNELNKKEMSSTYDLQKAKNKYDQAVQSLNNARSALKKAEKNLQNAIITSPIDGIVIARNVEEGQTVAASMNAPTLYIIANNLRKMQINADVDEADIGKIRIDESVEFTVDAFSNEHFYGKVKQVRLSPSTTQNVVTYTVVIDVDNPQIKLLPGMTANVTIVVQEKENILRIPESAIRFKPSKELWKQFGLKWDDSITEKTSGRMSSSAPEFSSNSNRTVETTDQQNKSKAQPQLMTDSLKTKLLKMTPEQRAAFRAKMAKSEEKRTVTRSTYAEEQISLGADTATTRQSKNRVWVLVDGKPTAANVVTGLSDGTYIEVISGLDNKQELITGVNYKNAKQAATANKSVLQTGGGFGMRP